MAAPAGGPSAIGDFNNDGKPDIVNAGSDPVTQENLVSVLIGNGDGTFSLPDVTPLNSTATMPAIAGVGDFNHDGKLDVLITAGGSTLPSLQIWLGDGIGHFSAGAILPVSGTFQSIVVDDFNLDGNLDVVVASTSSIVVLPGKGDGSFATPITTQVTGTYASNASNAPILQVADLDSDGKLDLLADYSGGAIILNPSETFTSYFTNIIPLLGRGDGTFQQANALQTPSDGPPVNLVSADFNGDGIPDIAEMSEVVDPSGIPGSENTQVFFGKGDGTFSPPELYNLPAKSSTPYIFNQRYLWIATADTDNTSGICPELLIVANKSVYLYPNLGSGAFNITQFGSPIQFLAGNPSAILAADVNLDGIPDLITTDGLSGAVLLGKGNNSFVQPAAVADAGAVAKTAAFGDFNGDGNIDVLTSTGVLLAGGSAPGFAPPRPIGVSGDFVVSADFNRDGRPDAAFSSGSTITVLPGIGNGSFGSATVYTLDGRISGLTAADVTGDGQTDLVAWIAANNEIAILAGSGNGTFSQLPSIGVPASTSSFSTSAANPIAVADFNKDGHPDIALLQSNEIVIFLGSGGGGFGPPVSVLFQNIQDQFGNQVFVGSALLAADINGDGNPDLVAGLTTFEGSRGYSLRFIGNGNGSFSQQMPLDGVLLPAQFALADANGEGITDLIACGSSGDISVAPETAGGVYPVTKLYIAGSSCSQVFGGNLGAVGYGILTLGTNSAGDASVTEILDPGGMPALVQRRFPPNRRR